MANREGTSYCPGYKSKSADIPERHEDARESKPMLPSHDRYSLAVLMEQCDKSNGYKSLIKLVKDDTRLDEIVQQWFSTQET